MSLLKSFLLLCIMQCSFLTVFSQSYIPIDTVYSVEKKLFLNNFTSRHESNLDQIKEQFSGENKKKIHKMYVESFESLSKEFKKGEVYFEKENQNYLNKLLQTIIESNEELKKLKIAINFSRSTSPNAYSVGDGTLLVHLDLLTVLDHEAELVSILCHEISHYKLDHRNKSIQKSVERITSKEFKKEEKEIIALKYNKQKRAEKFVKNVVYSRKSKSREHELQADSLGFELFRKTKFNSKYFARSLKNLEKSDIEKDSLVAADYKRFFTTKNQKFYSDWLQMEDFSNYKYSKEHLFKWNIDSLKTHPNCEERIKSLPEVISNSKSEFSIDASFFQSLKTKASYERICNFYFYKEYGYSLYETLKLFKFKKTDPFLTKMVYENLVLLTKAKKEMKLNNFIPSINPNEQTKSQQLYFNFINNLTLKELENLTADYKELTN